MAEIITRAGKGSPLTNAEMDSNLVNLNNELGQKQQQLVSGENIKSINGESLLDDGDIVLDSGAFVSLTPPPSRSGRLWLKSDEGALKVCYQDGDSVQWIDPFPMRAIAGAGSGATSAYNNEYVLTGETANATETEIFVGGQVGERILLPADTVVAYSVEVLAVGLTDVASFELKSVARNKFGVTSDIGSVYELVIARTDASINVDARIATGVSAIGLYVTGPASKAISWRAVVKTVEIQA
jgi:hypothetical protein